MDWQAEKEKGHINKKYKINYYHVFSSNFFRKSFSGIAAKSDMNLQLNSCLTRRPSLPPKFLTFFIGIVSNKLGILEGGSSVCWLGLCKPHASLAKICEKKVIYIRNKYFYYVH